MLVRTMALALALLLGACGGGGGGGSTTPPAGGGNDPGGSPAPVSVTVSGTVAANTALAGYEVHVLAPEFSPSSPGVEVTDTTKDADGSYSVTVTEQGPPFIILAGRSLLDAEPQYPRLGSIAIRGGTANVTPLTDLLASRLVNRKSLADLPFLLDSTAVSRLRNLTDADISAARQEVLAYLLNRPSKNNGNVMSSMDVSDVSDFISMPLSATLGDPHFEALRRLHNSLMDTETNEGVKEHMLFGNDAPADLSPMLAFDFMADCNVFNTDDGTLPKGATRIVLNQNGARLGTLDLAFQPGTKLDVSGQFWVFTFAGGTFFQLFFFADQLLFADVFIPGGGSTCAPQSSVPAPSRLPSQMALIKRFTQALTGTGFQCSNVPGFQNGLNQASIEANGALRINGALGPAFHLPSMDITYRAEIAAAGSPPTIRTKSLRGDRLFKGGTDQLELFLDNAGQLTAVFVARQRNGLPFQSQICGLIV